MQGTPIEPIRWWVQKVLPTVYDDSLSFQELLGKVIVKINEVIENVDSFEDSVINNISGFEEYVEGQLSQYMTEEQVQALIDDVVAQIGLLDAKIDFVGNQKLDKATSDSPMARAYVFAENYAQSSVQLDSGANPGTIVARDAAGRFKATEPSVDGDVANKKYVDDSAGEKVDKVSVGSGEEVVYAADENGDKSINVAVSATAGTVVKRGSNGTVSVGTPSAGTHATTKTYVDNGLSGKVNSTSTTSNLVYVHRSSGVDDTTPYTASAPNGGSFVVRTSGGQIVIADPTSSNHGATKAYVDSAISGIGGVSVTNLFTGTVTAGHYIAQDFPACNAYIIEYTCGTSGIYYQRLILDMGSNAFHSSICGQYSATSGATYNAEIQIGVPQDTTKRSLYFSTNNITTIPSGYGDITVTNAWGVKW